MNVTRVMGTPRRAHKSNLGNKEKLSRKTFVWAGVRVCVCVCVPVCKGKHRDTEA